MVTENSDIDLDNEDIMEFIKDGPSKKNVKRSTVTVYDFTHFIHPLHLRKITQDFTKDRLMFVPYLKMNKEYSDKDLFKKFGIDNNEIKFIEEKVKEMVLD